LTGLILNHANNPKTEARIPRRAKGAGELRARDEGSISGSKVAVPRKKNREEA
jgi:hypothetical protein